MTTAAQARAACRSRIEAGDIVDSNSQPVPFRWPNEEADSLGNVGLPDTPAPFAFVEMITDRGSLVAFGGGHGANRYRNQATLSGFVFVQKGEGVDQAESIAEQIAALFRSVRDSDINCTDATVYDGGDAASLKPSGMSNLADLGAYYFAAFEVSLWFDQIG